MISRTRGILISDVPTRGPLVPTSHLDERFYFPHSDTISEKLLITRPGDLLPITHFHSPSVAHIYHLKMSATFLKTSAAGGSQQAPSRSVLPTSSQKKALGTHMNQINRSSNSARQAQHKVVKTCIDEVCACWHVELTGSSLR